MIDILFENVEEILLKLAASGDDEKEKLAIAMKELLVQLKNLSVSSIEFENRIETVRINAEVIALENRNMKLLIQTLLGVIRTNKELISDSNILEIVVDGETFLQGV